MFLLLLFFGTASLTGCGGIVGSLTSAPPPSSVQNLTASDVTALIQTAAQAADPEHDGDRRGGPRRTRPGRLQETCCTHARDRKLWRAGGRKRTGGFARAHRGLFSATIRRRSLRARCDSSAAFIFRLELATHRTRRCTESKTPIADARSPPISLAVKLKVPPARSISGATYGPRRCDRQGGLK